jgi:hypothetical protein
MNYADTTIESNDEELRLRWYYFPFGTKRIAWRRITNVREHDMGTGITGGRWRIWGSGDLVHWMPLDVRRPKKRRMFILEIEGSPFRPCVTPDDPDAFQAALASHGIEVRPARKPYRD